MNKRSVVTVVGWLAIIAAGIVASVVMEQVWGWDSDWGAGYVTGALATYWITRGSIPWDRAQKINEATVEMHRILDERTNNREAGGQ